MTLPEICIKRPVFATVLSLVILLIGLISYQRLSVREYPRIDEPVVSVSTTYRGASAEVVESQVTKVLEDSLSGIEGVELMTSQSRSERSQINVRFRLSRDPDSPPPTCATRCRACAAGCRTKSTSRSSPRSRPIRSRSLHRGAGGLADAARGVRLRRALHQAAAVGAARRRGRAHLRRARRCRCASTSTARGSPATSSPCRTSRTPSAGRTPRFPPGRIESTAREFTVVAETDITHARAVRQHHRRQRRRLSGAHPRRRHRGRSARSTSAPSRATTASPRSTSA